MRRLTDIFYDTQQINFKNSSATNYMLNFSSPLERLGEAILGGENNIITGDFSAILGGSGNNDGGIPYTGIFGNGILATPFGAPITPPSSFWVDELVATNIPVVTALTFPLLPIGALYTMVGPGGPVGSRPIYVK